MVGGCCGIHAEVTLSTLSKKDLVTFAVFRLLVCYKWPQYFVAENKGEERVMVSTLVHWSKSANSLKLEGLEVTSENL